MIWTVFSVDDSFLPQDFSTYEEAETFGEELEKNFNSDYVIESTSGTVM